MAVPQKKFAAFAVLLVVLGALEIDGLRCYTSDAVGGAKSENCTDCKYCVVAPDGVRLADPVNLLGIGAESEGQKAITAFDAVFKLSFGLHQILTICIFEAYNWPGLDLNQPVEYQFRCFCRYDNCNEASGLEDFLNRLIIDRAAHKQGPQ